MSNNWMGDFLNQEKKLEVEAFSDSKITRHYQLVDRMGDKAVIAKRANGGKTKAVAARIDLHLIDRMAKHGSGPVNSQMNALIELALDILDEKNQTLLAE
jgi:hypothetical protein